MTLPAKVQTSLLAAVCLLPGCQFGERSEYEPREVAAVSSTDLADTEIVATLDTPLAESGNALWCATFQVAWNRARDDVIGGPIRVVNAQEIADRLNDSPVIEADLPPDDYFVAAGSREDGIEDTIRHGMAQNFPNAPAPDFPDVAGFVAFAHLETQAMFTTPFSERGLQFTDSAGVEHSVRGFGLQSGDWDLSAEQASQVKVLFTEVGPDSQYDKQSEFALDLTADQDEQQVIVAVLPRTGTLNNALDELERRTNEFPRDAYSRQLQDADFLAISIVAFHVIHEFAELLGTDKTIENAGAYRGMFIESARQSIGFRLDRSGATVFSQADMDTAASVSRNFTVDQPFLIVMKRRSAQQPYFVAWIDNAEFLEQ